MAATEEVPRVSTSKPASELEHVNGPAPENRKRKPSEASDGIEEDSPKRARRDNNGRTQYEDRSQSPVARRGSSPDRALPNEAAKRASATTEEKKRGKRLFGGLLSTLSQTNTNNQQRRRQEIEQRQHDKLHKQKVEDDQKRAERYAQVRKVRMVEQIGFEKRVMDNKHAKMLWTAKHLKTKAEPPIYYLPWKLTKDQDDLIESQIHDAREIVFRELEEFKERERRHEERYGHRRLTPPPRAFDAPPKQTKETERSIEKVEEASAKTDPTAAELEQKPTARAVRHDHEDDPGDVMVEAGEDMVIY